MVKWAEAEPQRREGIVGKAKDLLSRVELHVGIGGRPHLMMTEQEVEEMRTDPTAWQEAHVTWVQLIPIADFGNTSSEPPQLSPAVHIDVR